MQYFRFGSFALGVAFVLTQPTQPESAEARTCAEYAGELVSVQGTVEYRNGAAWQPITLGQQLCDREAVRTGRNSRAAIRLVDDAVLRLDENTTVVLADVAPEPDEPSFLELVLGAIQSFSRDPQTVRVDAPYINATVEGTEFALRVTPEESSLTVIEGVVLAANDLGSVRVASGQGAVASEGTAPRSVAIVRPRDAIAWGLYYPPTLSLSEAEASGVPALAEAARLARENRPDAAIARLEATPDASSAVRLFPAGLLLSVGRIDEAGALLDAVLSAEPENGVALAQSAVIDIVSNEREAGLAKAERAVAATPDAAAPHIALSYAQQAQFRLEGARDTLLAASQRVPDSALIWARLSEIWLTLGYRDRSGEAADRALALDPQLERAHVMKGFAALTEYRTTPAAEAFERAVQLDPADPLPRLGLGLAKIREGELEAGRAELDAAVALDSNRSLLRSYLGKAYFEEDRNELAAEQLIIAKDLDPQDPTPYLYDAIRLQTENRPGEALGAIQESIARNENRAVYRGRLQLDQDQAARTASLGRIYEDLGFIELGMREATRSQALDPANAAAHRFLADIYRNERRRELARVSELTRSQLLQDVNLNPVQPSMTETNLNLVPAGGPANPGFNEFTSLFASDGFHFTSSGTIGNHETFGGEAAIALQDDNVSVSFGAFEFDTDGFRDNFSAQHTIYDLFAQWAVTPELDLQAEFRHRDSSLGDLDLNFDPDVFARGLDVDFKENSARFGVRYSPDPRNNTLGSFIWADREASELAPQFPPESAAEVFDGDGWQAELQHIYQQENFSLTIGGLFGNFDEDRRIDVFAFDALVGQLPLGVTERRNRRVYAYGTIDLPIPPQLGDLALTLGVSYESYREEINVSDGDLAAISEFLTGGFLPVVEDLNAQDVDEVNPKLGLLWDVNDDLALRAAYFETVKPSFVTNRTIEPTQIAGFNQFFDDVDGASTKRYGVGADYRVTDKIFVGAEATWRDIELPFLDTAFVFDPAIPGVVFEGGFPVTDWQERTHRAYVNLLPHERVPVSIEFIYDRFEADTSELTLDLQFPKKVQTFSVPVTVRYFDPSGFFAGVRGSYVHQEVDRQNSPPSLDGTSDFFNVDLVAGYRFPHERGSLTLEVQNLTDNKFDFQDDGFREFTNFGATGPYFPDFGVLGRLTINF